MAIITDWTDEGLKKLRIDGIIERLRSGKMKTNHKTTIDGHEYMPLEVIINSAYDGADTFKLVKELIELGCSPDDYVKKFSQTSIITAINNIIYSDGVVELLELLLKHHKKGHDSDFYILKAATEMDQLFEMVLSSGMVDVEATWAGAGILNVLAKSDTSAIMIDLVFKHFPSITVNRLNHRDKSPLNIAIHEDHDMTTTIEALLKNEHSKIIGPVSDRALPTIIKHEMVDRYEGDFF